MSAHYSLLRLEPQSFDLNSTPDERFDLPVQLMRGHAPHNRILLLRAWLREPKEHTAQSSMLRLRCVSYL